MGTQQIDRVFLPDELVNVIAICLASQGVFRVLIKKDMQSLHRPEAGDRQCFIVRLQYCLDALFDRYLTAAPKLPLDQYWQTGTPGIDRTLLQDSNGHGWLDKQTHDEVFSLAGWRNKNELFKYVYKAFDAFESGHPLRGFLLSVLTLMTVSEPEWRALRSALLTHGSAFEWMQLNLDDKHLGAMFRNRFKSCCIDSRSGLEECGWGVCEVDYFVSKSPLFMSALYNPDRSSLLVQLGCDPKLAMDDLCCFREFLKKHALMDTDLQKSMFVSSFAFYCVLGVLLSTLVSGIVVAALGGCGSLVYGLLIPSAISAIFFPILGWNMNYINRLKKVYYWQSDGHHGGRLSEKRVDDSLMVAGGLELVEEHLRGLLVEQAFPEVVDPASGGTLGGGQFFQKRGGRVEPMALSYVTEQQGVNERSLLLP